MSGQKKICGTVIPFKVDGKQAGFIQNILLARQQVII